MAELRSDLKILVVDDQENMRHLLRVSLESLGLKNTYEAADGQAALATLRDIPDMDLVISDLRMTPMSGLDLLTKVRQLYPSLPFIMVTASDSHEDLMAAKQAGVTHYLFKPYTGDDIRKRVEVVMHGKISPS